MYIYVIFRIHDVVIFCSDYYARFICWIFIWLFFIIICVFYIFFENTSYILGNYYLIIGMYIYYQIAYKTNGSEDNDILQQLKEYEHIGIVRSITIFRFCYSLLSGFLIYLGNKKREYGKI